MMSRKPKNLIWNVPFFGRGVLFFGFGAKDCTVSAKQYTAFVRFLGGKAKFSAVEVKDLANAAEIFALEAENITPDSEPSAIEAENITFDAEPITIERKDFGGKVKYPVKNTERATVETKNLGLQPKDSAREIKIFTFGLFVLRIDSRFRAGFINRRQILIEA